jgi:nitrogen regulatory protein PII
MIKKCSLVTTVIHISLLKNLLAHLSSLGINHLYSSFGRSVELNDTRGWTSFFRTSDISNEPVEVLYFYIPIEFEKIIMKSIGKICRLDIPGRGSIFSRHMHLYHGAFSDLISEVKQDKIDELDCSDFPLFHNMTQIFCTMAKGLADDVARLLLHLGVVPVITNASGTGLRDQLGLLRITIPKEKELLSIVVGQHEAGSVMDKLITWGKLDRPGRGFIWQVPIEHGLINFKTSQKVIGQAASTEQIIAAIDSLKGHFSWRQGGSTLTGQSRRSYFRGTEFLIQTPENGSLFVSQEMNKLGISGATVQLLKTLTTDKDDENIVVPQEVIRVVVSEDQKKRVDEYFSDEEKVQAFDSKFPTSCLFGIPVMKAFNYRTPK